uniref:Uncharacterized protein n=1 Tax=Romanomermis culicivorax TaxID=13658 RepID=A0A915JUL6_ROMCU
MNTYRVGEAGPANLNPDADGLPPGNLIRSPSKVELAGRKRDVITPEFCSNLDERDPEIDQRLERTPQDQERFWPQERAPGMSTQELARQLGKLKGT